MVSSSGRGSSETWAVVLIGHLKKNFSRLSHSDDHTVLSTVILLSSSYMNSVVDLKNGAKAITI